MPLVPIIQTPNYQVALWYITESVDQLSKLLNYKAGPVFGKDNRNTQWLASRLLLKEMLQLPELQLQKTETGKPYLTNSSLELSLSHSAEYAAAIACPAQETGIDIEKIDPRIFRIAHKFLNDFDKQFVAHDDLLGHYLVWNTKEVLFKYYSKGAVDFRKHLFVDLSAINRHEISAIIKKEDFHAKISLTFKVIDTYLLTWINHDKPIERYG